MARQELNETVTYEEDGNVGIWSISDINAALDSGDLEDAEDHFRRTVDAESMDSAVVSVGNAESLDSDVLAHINEEWTTIGEETGLDATAYVAEGISKLAIVNKNEATDMEKDGFDTVDEAVEWAESFA